MRLIIASNNKNKIREIKEILGDKFEEIVSMREAGIELDVEEDADSFIGNARKKAEETAKLCPQDAVLADDSGLCVDALNGAPGVYSARFAGEDCDSRRNIEKVLILMGDCMNRKARFVTVFALILNNKIHFFEGEVQGTILKECRGDDGFGYDPIFLPEGSTLTFAEMSHEAKNSISHRGKASAKLVEFLKSML